LQFRSFFTRHRRCWNDWDKSFKLDPVNRVSLRSALVLAAADPQGLTLLSVLRQFPTRSIRIDLKRSIQIASELESQPNKSGDRADQAAVSRHSNSQPVNFSSCQTYGDEGRFTWNKRH